MIVFLYILAFLGIGLFELPALIFNKHWREVIAFLVFYSFAFLLGLLIILRVNLPSPTDGIRYLVEKVFH